MDKNKSVAKQIIALEEAGRFEEAQALWDESRRQGHADLYPEGCSVPGHRCEECAERVGDTPHPYIKVGARRGYKGSWVCNVPTCPYYRQF